MFSTISRIVKWVILALFGVAFVAFAASNHETVSISLFPLAYAIDLPKFLLAIICVFVGVFMTFIAMGLRISKIRQLFVHEKKRAAALETELKSLKAKNNLPATLDGDA